MITTFLVCMVALVANNCETLHPDLWGLIPKMDDQTYPLQQVDLRIMDCQDMYSNLTLMQICYQKWGPEIDP